MQISRTALPTRIQGGAVDDLGKGVWCIWLHTRDWIYGTYLVLYPNGKIEQITCREDEGDQVMCIKPANTNEEM